MMFQSTHPYRVRLPFPPSVSALLSFNPRTHTGCDFLVSEIIPNTSCFNPRTHTGCDEINQCAKRSVCKFQSTHPYRVRHKVPKRKPKVIKFQSTHPYRVRRNKGTDAKHSRFVSIHAPIQGATPSVRRLRRRKEVSIHAPIQGATSHYLSFRHL